MGRIDEVRADLERLHRESPPPEGGHQPNGHRRLSHTAAGPGGGLPFFILDAQFSHRTDPLTIAGPPGLEERVRDAIEVLFAGSSRTEQRFPIDVRRAVDRKDYGAPVGLGGSI
jgi:hypothetical protein